MKKRKALEGSLTGGEIFKLVMSILFFLSGTLILGFIGYQKKLMKKRGLVSLPPKKVQVKKKKIPFEEGTQEGFYVDKFGVEMVKIAKGDWKRDQQKVTLPMFLIETTEVTYKQYQRFLKENPKWQKGGEEALKKADSNYLKDWKGLDYPKGKDDHPVVWVSWYAAKAYAKWADKRLPTVLEWERAASGKDWKTYPWGDDEPTPQRANFGMHYGKTLKVRTLEEGVSETGCYHMAGNVWEWCE
ncbi:MAG: formylglycine-generating enzyme family protein, partial [Planctomycetota bacterium]